jgi:methyltransferase (TIGR00027 family)
METGRASKTALSVARRRAVHQLLDQPPVLMDPVAIPLLGAHFEFDHEREMHPFSRAFRAFMASRSRYAEDNLAAAAAQGAAQGATQSATQGVDQYVVLGAGLDTFAYRNPFAHLRVFEVDFPATQQWKRALLEQAAIPLPAGLTFVPLDFEHKTLSAGLAESGFDAQRPAFFSWLGVVPYLTLEAFRATIETIARLPAGSGVSFDYGVPRRALSLLGQMAFDRLAARVAAAGEPFRLFFTADELQEELRRAGFHRIEDRGSEQLNALYFAGRADGLKLPAQGMGRMATAWV